MGMVPQAVSLTQTSDPRLKCCVEECNNFGTSTAPSISEVAVPPSRAAARDPTARSTSS